MASRKFARRRYRRQRMPVLPLLLGVLVLLLGLYLYLRPRGLRPEQLLRRLAAPGPTAEQKEESSSARPALPEVPGDQRPSASKTPPLELPSLERSDGLVRELARGLSSHPAWAAWLAHEELLRRFVASVDNVAAGESPRAHLPFLAPRTPFHPVARGERLYLPESGGGRYDAVADAVTSLDTQGCVRLYRQLRPLLEQAYRELGYPEGNFHTVLLEALGHLIATPIPSAPVELVPGVWSYEFADPELEALSAAQKHLLRFGSRNALRVQGKLRELAAALAEEGTGASPGQAAQGPR